MDQEKFNETKEEAEEFYRSLGSVLCPYFNEKVNFNAKGLDHIKFKKWNKTRVIDDQYMRLKLIKYAPEVIKKSNTLQGYLKKKSLERIKTNSKWKYKMMDVDYYEFVSIIDSIRIRVIVKHVLGGEKYFWSIIPFWKMDLKNKERLMHNGDPEDD